MKTEKLFFLLSVYFYPNKTFREKITKERLLFLANVYLCKW